MPRERYEARAAFLLGKLYVVGGLDPNGDAISAVDVYDPATRTWSAGAAMPQPVSSPGIAVVGGQIYVVGGCHDIAQCGQSAVQIYDPVANSWSTAADYPVATSWLSCGGIGKGLYCAGGVNMAGSLATGYSYDPAADAWTPIAELPSPLWGASTAAQGGRLLVSGGVIGAAGALTNAGFAYDPSADAWTSLPNANEASYGAAGACGLYRIGGRVDPTELSQTVEVLPGYGGCSGNGAPTWLSATPATATLPPGASTTVTVTFDATTVAQPGSYSAGLTGAENTPYPALQVPVTMTVTPPARWGELSGTVTGTSCSGSTAPLPGATVSVVGWAQQITVNTDASGRYDVWMDVRNNPLTVYVALDGWSPVGQNVKITKGTNKTLDLRLTPDHC